MTSTDNDPNHPIFIVGATNHVDQMDEAIKSRFTYNIEIKPGNKTERQQFLEFVMKKRGNPYSEEAKQYLFNVVNESLERLPLDQKYKTANRTLENLLKQTASTLAQSRGNHGPRRTNITIADLKQAYKLTISPNTTTLEQIEKEQPKTYQTTKSTYKNIDSTISIYEHDPHLDQNIGLQLNI